MNVSGLRATEVEQPRRRRWPRFALIAVVSLTLAGGAGIWAFHSRSSGHRLIYTETLPDGRVFQCFSDGAFIGSAGTRVEAGRAPQPPPGSEAGPALVVHPPDYGDQDAGRAAEEYQKSGRSLERDQADLDRLSAECRRRR